MTRTAIIHEWFTALAGSEKVVEQVCQLYPAADLFAVYADPKVVEGTDYLKHRRLQTTFIQHLPLAPKQFRSYLLLMPLAVEQLDVSSYEVVLSSSHAVAKGVLTGPDQLHISYVHSPIRYAWDLQHQYLREAKLAEGPKAWLAKWMLHKMRIWDYRTAAGVNHFVANSRFIARRIRKVYGRGADVIHPPVDVLSFQPRERKDPFYLAASRMVPYKKMDLIVDAFSQMPDKRLVVIGDGPEYPKVKAAAGPNVELMGFQPDDVLRDMMQRAQAFVFAAEEDFGIMPVEAQACGTPVIAFGKGGALETIRPEDHPEPTGVFFPNQTAASLAEAVKSFERQRDRFEPLACRDNALRFSTERFRREFAEYVARRHQEFQQAR
ncbi:MAG: glycosyltransferase family 4 protein [Myxococcales bacterium]|nr:glycosyltransferase family 4 protein [Myxococcales bacterium]MDD9969949.1 glycosyltransferase family 4 protein [Myxococcales bacterium]